MVDAIKHSSATFANQQAQDAISINGVKLKQDQLLKADQLKPIPEALQVTMTSSQQQIDKLESINAASLSDIKITQAELIYHMPKVITTKSFSNVEQADESSHSLVSRQSNNLLSQRVAGGISRINSLIERGESEYSQDIRLYQRHQIFDANHQELKLDTTNFEDDVKKVESELFLQLKTADGDEIRLSLEAYQGHGKAQDDFRAGFRGLAIDFSMQGELSAEEKEALAEITQAVEKAFKQYMDTGEFRLADLNLTEQSQFSDVAFKLKGQTDNGMPARLDLKYHDSEDKRDISLKLNGHSSNISIDKTSLGAQFMHLQGEEAMYEYIQLLSTSGNEVDGDDEAKQMMLAMFEDAFANLEASENSKFNNNLPLSADQEKNLITLPDFDFSFRSEITMPNFAEMPLEYAGFKLNLSLNTDVEIDKKYDTAHIKQKQNFDLEGAFYSPQGLLKKPDFISQTYKYTQLEREAEKVTELLIDDGQVAKAISTQTEKDHSLTKSYEGGKLVDEQEEGDSVGNIRDFTVLAQQERLEMDQQLMDILIIDPFLDHRYD